MAAKGEYYAEYDEESGLFCVFNTDDVGKKESGFAFSSWATMEQAEKDAIERNSLTML